MRHLCDLEALFTYEGTYDVNALLGAMDRVLYLGHGGAALGPVEAVVTGDVLSPRYGTPLAGLRVKGRILVVSGHGPRGPEAATPDA